MERYYLAAEMLVTEDLFDIGQRLKELDEGYFVTYDRARGVYGLRHTGDPPGRPPLLLFGDRLDARALIKARYTLAARADKLFAELDGAGRS